MIPYWYLIVGVLLTAVVAVLVGRGRLRDERELRIAAEEQVRAATFAVGRARAQRVASDAMLRGFPEPMSPRDVPPRGYAMDATALEADWPLTMPTAPAEPVPAEVAEDAARSPELAAALEAVHQTEQAMRPDAEQLLHNLDPVRLDLASAYDIEPPGDDDEPRDEERVLALGRRDQDDDADEGEPPVAGPPEPVSAAAEPRYDWSLAQPVGKRHAVAPDWGRWAWHRQRIARWSDVPRAWWGRLRRARLHRLTGRLAELVGGLRSRPTRRPAYVGRHSPEVTGTWPWSQVADRLTEAPKSVLLRKAEYAERTGARWMVQLASMREALRPPRRSLTPNLPSIGCRP